jgi:adenine-specific DNA methylase
MPTTALAMGTASLETSVTVACRPRVVGSAQALKRVREEIEIVVKRSVARFWSYGFRGSDLMVACYGPAVGVFGKYERVEKDDGTAVSIPELLDLARKAGRDASRVNSVETVFQLFTTFGRIFMGRPSSDGMMLGCWFRLEAMPKIRWKSRGGTGFSSLMARNVGLRF